MGIIFSFLGFGAGDPLMPTFTSDIVSLNIDTSLFFGFSRGFMQLFSNIPNLIMIVFSLLFVTFFDTTGTLISLGRQCGFIDENGQTKGIEKAFLSDAVGGIIGSICGTSTVTAYVESATGIGLGGRTGLTAIVTGVLFLISIFFAPVVLSLFTAPVTASALVIVGILMIVQIKEINWDNIVVASSVFMTMLMTILTYSISLGIAWGFLTYAIATIGTGKFKEMNWGFWVLSLIFALYLFFGL